MSLRYHSMTLSGVWSGDNALAPLRVALRNSGPDPSFLDAAFRVPSVLPPCVSLCLLPQFSPHVFFCSIARGWGPMGIETNRAFTGASCDAHQRRAELYTSASWPSRIQVLHFNFRRQVGRLFRRTSCLSPRTTHASLQGRVERHIAAEDAREREYRYRTPRRRLGTIQVTFRLHISGEALAQSKFLFRPIAGQSTSP